MGAFKDWFEIHRKDVVNGVLIVLVATLSFGLGYLYANETRGKTPIVIEKISDNDK